MDIVDKEKLISDYTERYNKFGYNPKTLGWDKGKQNLRFSILTSLFEINNSSILDIGCGFGDLNKYLCIQGYAYDYTGVDLVESLVEEAKKFYPERAFYVGDFLEQEFSRKFDYVIGSGIFNRKFVGSQDNYDFIYKSMQKAFDLCKKGLAFDFLSDRVDWQYEHTFHSNPMKILEMAFGFSRNVVLRNDYMPFEFCVTIFKDDSFKKEDTIFNYYKERCFNEDLKEWK